MDYELEIILAEIYAEQNDKVMCELCLIPVARALGYPYRKFNNLRKRNPVKLFQRLRASAMHHAQELKQNETQA